MPDFSNKKFFLIDGNSFCYRAYYAIRHLSNSKGQPTNAIYGFATMLKKILKDEKPDMIAVAFDLKGPTFRHKKYEGYKITRKPMPDDLVLQLPYIKKIIKAYGISIFEMEGYEADDILATLAYKAKSRGIKTYIVTSDKDALQLVDNDIKIYNPHKDNIIYDEKEVKKRFGINPDKIPDLMALMGDNSDDIPGVPGIGEKTAVLLLKRFSSLENLLKNIDKIKSDTQREKIAQNRELALLSKELATINKDVPIRVDFDKLNLREPNEEMLLEIFKELEFRTLLKEIKPKKDIKAEYYLIRTEKDFLTFYEILKTKDIFAFDVETTHYDPMKAEIVGISFCWDEKEAYYIPLNALEDISKDGILSDLKEIFENPSIRKIGQNIKYDLLILKNLNINLEGIYFDTMIASYLLNPSKAKHNLSDICLEYLGYKMTDIEELIGKGKKAITMDMVPPEKVCNYCCEDSNITFRLKNTLEKLLDEYKLDRLFYEVEIPLVEVLSDIERWGVCIDKGYLKELSGKIEKELVNLEESIYRLAGEEFNINSSKQLQIILFEKMKLPIIKRTKTGISTDEEVLKKLSEKEELPKEILRYRELAKLKSTYVDSLSNLINEKTGRLHASFNQTVTATGRLSSSNPNLQNIPIKTEWGKSIRKAFIAEKEGYTILSCDYSQIELRILAHLSSDDGLITAFYEGRDIHVFTASLIWGLPERDITEEMRQTAKTVNFGVIYGMSAYGLSKDLGIGVHEASKFIEAYFERYPRVKEYIEEQIKDAKEKGFVTTILGRRRYIPEINSVNQTVKNFAERTAVNTPIQGSAADLIKLAMINIHKEIRNFDAKMIIQVHDELVFEVKKSQLIDFARMVKEKMENVMMLKVPICVKIECGKNWLDMESMNLK